MNHKGTYVKFNEPTLREEQVFRNFRKYGSPLSRPGTPGLDLTLEQTLADGLEMARRFPFVGQVWPVFYARNASNVNWDKLETLARASGHGDVLGFYAAVLGSLTGDPWFHQAESRLADTKSPEPQNFFLVEYDQMMQELALHRTPEEARRWNFVMATTLDHFRETWNTWIH